MPVGAYRGTKAISPLKKTVVSKTPLISSDLVNYFTDSVPETSAEKKITVPQEAVKYIVGTRKQQRKRARDNTKTGLLLIRSSILKSRKSASSSPNLPLYFQALLNVLAKHLLVPTRQQTPESSAVALNSASW